MSRRQVGMAGLGALTAALVVVSVAALVRFTGGEAASAAVRKYAVTMKLTQATVAGVSTIAVTNLPADAIAYEGDTVEFTITNESPIDEGFAIDAYGIKEVLKPGETKTVRLENVRAGAYAMYCQLHPLSVHHAGTLLVPPKP